MSPDPTLCAPGEDWLEILDEAFGDLTGKIAAAEVWKILGKPGRFYRTQDDNFRMGYAMRALGWWRTMQRFGYQSESAYVRGTRAETRVPIYVFICPVTGNVEIRHFRFIQFNTRFRR